MRQKLIESLTRRFTEEISEKNPIIVLKDKDFNEVLDVAIEVVFMFSRNNDENVTPLATFVVAIGQRIQARLKLKRDSALAAKVGAFVLYSFEELGMLKVVLGRGKGKHAAYNVDILDEDTILKLWQTVEVEKCEKLPLLQPAPRWTSGRNEEGEKLIKTNSGNVLSSLSADSHPMLFESANKAQEVGWMINKFVYETEKWAFFNKTEAFSSIWNLISAEARSSKIRETKTILSIAERFLGKTFYHKYYFDFRGRRYVRTAYLHEQGSDPARGLLLRADKRRITEQGFLWLLVSIASNWAGSCGREDGYKTDKIPLNDRVAWVLANEETFISYGTNPKSNTGWFNADCPWQFLAACRELKLFRDWQVNEWIASQREKRTYDEYGYESHLEVYVDGSNNGKFVLL